MHLIFALLAIVAAIATAFAFFWNKYCADTSVAVLKMIAVEVKKVRAITAEGDASLRDTEERLARTARSYMEAQYAERMKQTPIESLKTFGAYNIRWTALRQAGFDTLWDLSGVSASRLLQYQGIGQTTANIVSFVPSAIERIRAEPPRPPSSDLQAPYASELVEAFRLAQNARFALTAPLEEFKNAFADVDARFQIVRKEFGIWGWLNRQWTQKNATTTIDQMNMMLKDATAFLDSTFAQRLLGALAALSKAAPQTVDTTVADSFRSQLAEVIDSLEIYLQSGQFPVARVEHGSLQVIRERPRQIVMPPPVSTLASNGDLSSFRHNATPAPKLSSVATKPPRQRRTELPEIETTAASPQFTAANALLNLAVGIASADGDFCLTEQKHIEQLLGRKFELTTAEHQQLKMRLLELAETPPKPIVVQRHLAKLEKLDRQEIMKILIGVSLVDGSVDPGEVNVLVRVNRALGLDEGYVFSTINSMIASNPDSPPEVSLLKDVSHENPRKNPLPNQTTHKP